METSGQCIIKKGSDEAKLLRELLDEMGDGQHPSFTIYRDKDSMTFRPHGYNPDQTLAEKETKFIVQMVERGAK